MKTPPPLKKAPRRLLGLPKLLKHFIATESAGGMVMIAAAALALALANSPYSGWYQDLVVTQLAVTVGDTMLALPLKAFVKDVLMVLFFFVIGMELKQEMSEGFLARRDQIILPLLAAVGGMAVPALIYVALNLDNPAALAGWAIPSATDIAFALGVLMLAGPRIAPSAKIFLLAIAIFDDLGAIVVIALFYSTGLSFEPLAFAAAITGIMYMLQREGIAYVWLYVLLGMVLWMLFERAGVHTTMAGVITGLMIPLRDRQDKERRPLRYAMQLLHPWVTFLILPVFAFVNAGVTLTGMEISALWQPVALGIALGLFVGKQIGIFGITWAAIRLGLARMPDAASWMEIYAVSIIAGIGFTMSLFIGILAFFEPEIQDQVKIGVIMGSLLSAFYGTLILKLCCGNNDEATRRG